jgi:hypothetical protein
MGEVLGDELTEFISLAESINELIVKLYAASGKITFKFEEYFVRGVEPAVAFVRDYIGKRKEAFAVSYYSGESIRVTHARGVEFYTPFKGDLGTVSLRELYERLFTNPVVKDVVLRTAVNALAALLRDSLYEIRKVIDLESSIQDLKYIIKRAKDPVLLDEAKLLLAETVILSDGLSEIRKRVDSLIKKLDHLDAVHQLEDVIRELNIIIDEFKYRRHLVDRVTPIVKKTEILIEFMESFADVIEKIKEEAEKRCLEKESEDEY